MVFFARSTPTRRCATSMTGVMQFVVQLAHETIRGSPSGRFTPCTTEGAVSAVVGADRITYDAPALMCFRGSSLLVNTPVHSSTRSTPEIAPRQGDRVTFGGDSNLFNSNLFTVDRCVIQGTQNVGGGRVDTIAQHRRRSASAPGRPAPLLQRAVACLPHHAHSRYSCQRPGSRPG